MTFGAGVTGATLSSILRETLGSCRVMHVVFCPGMGNGHTRTPSTSIRGSSSKGCGSRAGRDSPMQVESSTSTISRSRPLAATLVAYQSSNAQRSRNVTSRFHLVGKTPECARGPRKYNRHSLPVRRSKILACRAVFEKRLPNSPGRTSQRIRAVQEGARGTRPVRRLQRRHEKGWEWYFAVSIMFR